MKIVKKPGESVPREDAHGGQGGRRLYVSDNELENRDFQAMTYGFLPPHGTFVWHSHEGIEEIMLVLKGRGVVRDADGEYPYKEGDLFVYPQNIGHEIKNTSDEEHEYIFVRTKV